MHQSHYESVLNIWRGRRREERSFSTSQWRRNRPWR